MAAEQDQPKLIKLFYSYSHEDEILRAKLEKHLSVPRRQGLIAEWHDRVIDAGDDWAEAIDRNLAAADIVLLLVSASFIASDYCWGEEMEKALARHVKGEARVIPVILRPCRWTNTRLAALQAVPSEGRPITAWPDQDAAFDDAVARIEKVATDIRRQRQAAEAASRAEAEARRREEEREAAVARRAKEEERRRRQEREAEAEADEHGVEEKGLAANLIGRKGFQADWKVGAGALLVLALVGGGLWHLAERKEEAEARVAAETAAAEKASADKAAAETAAAEKAAAERAAAEKAAKEAVEASRKPLDTFQECATCPQMKVLAGGTFQMGSPPTERDRDDDEGPQHKVTIKPFAIGRYEVTFAEWDACVADGGCNGYRPVDQGWGRGRRPVIDVSWHDAQAYVAWLSRKTGKPYRLPSEAEWEYAARAGTSTRYSIGDEITAKDANFGRNVGRTTEVGSYPGNPWGLSDMHGNVCEWVEDVWHDDYQGAPGNGSAWVEGEGQLSSRSRVDRGGSWLDYPWDLRSALRVRYRPEYRSFTLGFRVARALD